MSYQRDIVTQDPDGWAVEPTDAQREAFREWVFATYGPVQARAYFGG